MKTGALWGKEGLRKKPYARGCDRSVTPGTESKSQAADCLLGIDAYISWWLMFQIFIFGSVNLEKQTRNSYIKALVPSVLFSGIGRTCVQRPRPDGTCMGKPANSVR